MNTTYLTKRIAFIITLIVSATVSQTAQATSSQSPNHKPSQTEKMAWWQEARFGMFIHWGVYSVPAGNYQDKPVKGIGEWILKNAKIPVATYKGYAAGFNPTQFDADAWADLAKNSGMKYVVVTSKHHDGFAMYPSKVSDWDIADASPYKKDVIGELAHAFRAQDMKFGLYYSQAQDWVHAGGGIRKDSPWDDKQKGDFDQYLSNIALPQSKEILETYQPDILWWDTPEGMDEVRIQPFLRLVEQYPDLITNNRLATTKNYGDFSTPEQHIPATGMEGNFETCMTLNDTWGFKTDDHNWKSSEQLITKLVDIASKGGNFLLNVGPDQYGNIPPKTQSILLQMGDWLETNGEAIYGTSASQFAWLPWGRSTTKVGEKNSTLYLHVLDWPKDGKLQLDGLNNDVLSAELLSNKQSLSYQASDEDSYVFSVPKVAPSNSVSVIKVTIKGQPDIGYLYPQQTSIGDLTIFASQLMIHNTSYNANTQIKLNKVADDRIVTNWQKSRNTIEAIFKIKTPGQYQLKLNLKTAQAGKLLVQKNTDTAVPMHFSAAKNFAEQTLGNITFDGAGEYRVTLSLAKNGPAMSIKDLRFSPVH